MKIDGKTPIEGPGGRRLQAGKSAPKEGGKSFGAELKKAAAALPAPLQPDSAPQPTSLSGPAEAMPSAPAEARPPAGEPAAGETPPADHMELVKFRMRTGYYHGKNIEDALSDRLTGYFDELA